MSSMNNSDDKNVFQTMDDILSNGMSADGSSDSEWSPSLSASLYRIDGWGPPYFMVNSSGNISVRPRGQDTHRSEELDLFEIIGKVSRPETEGCLGFQLPLIIRFPEVLEHRLQSLQSAFDSAIQSKQYRAHYQGVFPVKTNQDRFVVDDIVRVGYSFKFGLEAGSKTELLLAMSSLCKGHPEALLVCNGFKDAEYISLALIGKKLAFNTVIVFEQEEELDLAIKLSKKFNIRPVLGVRAKLKTKHSGYYGPTSGEKGKFGLTSVQVMRIVRKLEHVRMLDCLQLLHFHIGSQIPTTAYIADGVSEAAQIYCELVRLGANMNILDIGGGLGIDYDGSKSSNSDVSVSYTMEEYASTVVGTLMSVCDRKSIKHPVICSESGRATVSHHSVLIFEASPSSYKSQESPEKISTLDPTIQNLMDGLQGDAREHYTNVFAAAMRRDYDTCLHYAEELKVRCYYQFKEGSLSIEQLAAAEELYNLVNKAVRSATKHCQVGHIYRVNLSIFASIPNYWGTGHLFPIIPIHRLDEKPSVRGILSDLTCDSDGKIGTFIGGEPTLPLHELALANDNDNDGQRYYLGLFLAGAYEESQGSPHNMLGRPNMVQVESRTDKPDGFVVTHSLPGQASKDLLKAMGHEPQAMIEQLERRAVGIGWEAGKDPDGVATAAGGLGRFLQSWPYLVDSSTWSFEPAV